MAYPTLDKKGAHNLSQAEHKINRFIIKIPGVTKRWFLVSK